MRGHSCPAPTIQPSVTGGSCPQPGLIINGIIVTYGLLQETRTAFGIPEYLFSRTFQRAEKGKPVFSPFFGASATMVPPVPLKWPAGSAQTDGTVPTPLAGFHPRAFLEGWYAGNRFVSCRNGDEFPDARVHRGADQGRPCPRHARMSRVTRIFPFTYPRRMRFLQQSGTQ